MSNQLTQELAVVSMALFSCFKHLVVFTQTLIARKPNATLTSIDHARTGLSVSLVSSPARLNETALGHTRPLFSPCAKRTQFNSTTSFAQVTRRAQLVSPLASPNNIHNSKKLRNRFWSGSAILIAAPLYVSCKNPHPQSKFRPIALHRTSN